MNGAYAEEEGKEEFWSQLTKKAPGDIELIMTGSGAELDIALYSESPSDFDFMFYFKDWLGITVGEVVAESFKGRVIRHELNAEGTHPGYTKIELRDSVDTIKSMFKNWTMFRRNSSGPAMKVAADVLQFFSKICVIEDFDIIFSIRCQGWPATASEWETRDRPSGWPSKDQVKAIVNGGYHLVDKTHPHHTTNPDVFWRLSFSAAEAVLVRSWSQGQKFVYCLLRKMKQKVVATGGSSSKPIALSTYIFKTAMLWECEQRQQDFWNVKKMAKAFRAIVYRVIEWLIDKHCPNYFIPSNNMLDHFTNFQDFDREVQLLLLFTESEFVTHTLQQLTPLGSTPSMLNFALEFSRLMFPPWMQIHCTSELRDQPVHGSIFSRQQNYEVHLELKHLHSALRSQLRTARHDRSERLNGVAEDNWHVPEQYFLQALHSDSQMNWSGYTLKDPTVNSTVYICSAYLANFYLVVKGDSAQAREICSAIFNVNKQNIWFTWVSEFSYPVLLSTEWSGVFDEHLQAAHGLCVLHNRFASENKGLGRVITIKICPMLFLRYINVQSLLGLGNNHSLQSAIDSFKHHLQNDCPSDRHTWSTSDDLSRSILLTVLHISLRLSDPGSWCIQGKANCF